MNEMHQGLNRQMALSTIVAERNRQNDLKATGKFENTPADPGMSHSYCLTVIVEEVGEIARAIQKGDRANMRDEITQVAAIALGWLEGFDQKVL
jgi:NTP pyrophosphatase (non-canonical NTP hydrolase)